MVMSSKETLGTQISQVPDQVTIMSKKSPIRKNEQGSPSETTPIATIKPMEPIVAKRPVTKVPVREAASQAPLEFIVLYACDMI